MQMPVCVLKQGKDTSVRAGHPWIFSHAVAHAETMPAGTLVDVRAHSGNFVGYGMWNPLTSIRIRIISRTADERIDEQFFARRIHALKKSKEALLPPHTNGFRLVHGDADSLPGLIVDVYGTCVVFQIHTAGMDTLRAHILHALEQVVRPSCIVERSDVDVRKIEGLQPLPGHIHHGAIPPHHTFTENGIPFYVDMLHGQKTGFFLDQRPTRIKIRQYVRNKRVLNLFCYSAASSVCAAHAGAGTITSVDSSRHAIEHAEQQFTLNNFNPDDTRWQFIEANVFDYVRDEQTGPFDVIICDPPAFAKSQAHLAEAHKAYVSVNRQCFRLLTPGGILVTSSCSGRLSFPEFRDILRHAAGTAGCNARVRDAYSQPHDHTDILAFPEGHYLKTMIVERV